MEQYLCFEKKELSYFSHLLPQKYLLTSRSLDKLPLNPNTVYVIIYCSITKDPLQLQGFFYDKRVYKRRSVIDNHLSRLHVTIQL